MKDIVKYIYRPNITCRSVSGYSSPTVSPAGHEFPVTVGVSGKNEEISTQAEQMLKGWGVVTGEEGGDNVHRPVDIGVARGAVGAPAPPGR